MKFIRLIFICLSCSLLLSCSAKEARAIHFGPGPDDEEAYQNDLECSDEDRREENSDS